MNRQELQTQENFTPPRILKRIISEQKLNLRSIYEAQWQNSQGFCEVTWQPLPALFSQMTKVLQFKLLKQVSNHEKDKIETIYQEDQQESCLQNQQCNFDDVSIISILKTNHSSIFDVQFMDKQTKRIFHRILSSAQLKQYFVNEYARFLQQQVYYRSKI